MDTSAEVLRQACRANPFMVKPNAEEALELTGLPINTPNETDTAVRTIQTMGVGNIIISLVNGQRAWLAASLKIVERN